MSNIFKKLKNWTFDVLGFVLITPEFLRTFGFRP